MKGKGIPGKALAQHSFQDCVDVARSHSQRGAEDEEGPVLLQRQGTPARPPQRAAGHSHGLQAYELLDCAPASKKIRVVSATALKIA